MKIVPRLIFGAIIIMIIIIYLLRKQETIPNYLSTNPIVLKITKNKIMI